MKKRIVALALCLLMALSLLPIPAMANANTDLLRQAIEYLRVHASDIKVDNYTTPESLSQAVMDVLKTVMPEDMEITATTKIDPNMRKNATTTQEGFMTADITLHMGSDSSNWIFKLTIPVAEESADEVSQMEADVAAVTAALADYFATAKVDQSNILQQMKILQGLVDNAVKHCSQAKWQQGSGFSTSIKQGYIRATLHMVLGGQVKDLKLDVTIHSDGSTTMNKPTATSAPATKPVEPTTPAVTPAPVTIPAAGTAYPSTQTVDLDGKQVTFQMYALKDQNGNPTNYVKVRDLALALNGTKAQFSVDWNGAVNLVAGTAYKANGSENKTPFSGNRAYTVPTSPTNVNGAASDLTAIFLTDDAGGGYTYYQLRDLGRKLGFNADWSPEKGVFIETNKPYSGA